MAGKINVTNNKNVFFVFVFLLFIIFILTGCVNFHSEKTITKEKNNTPLSEKEKEQIQITTIHSTGLQKEVTLKYFWSPYCVACRAEEPIITSFVKNHPTLKFIKIDVTKDNLEAKKYGILGQTPGFVLIKGDVVKTTSGYMPKKELTSFICSMLDDERCRKF